MNRPYRGSRPNRNQSRRRKPTDPILMGEPSPALTKIARMNTEKLKAHIETMAVEVDRLSTRISNLSKLDEVDEDKIENLSQQRARLEALMAAAKERLDGKLERSKNYGSGYTRR